MARDCPVLLADRARFPSPTCTTFYRRGGHGVIVLRRLGLLDAMLALGSPPLLCQYQYADGAATLEIGPPGEVANCLTVGRESLDRPLTRRAARSPGVELLEGNRATELLWRDGRVPGVQIRTPAGERTAYSRLVVGADGRRSFVARAIATPIQEEEAGNRDVYY